MFLGEGSFFKACVVVALFTAPLVFAGKQLSRDERIAIIRSFAGEIYVVKIALPAGKKGIFIDASGNFLGEKQAEKEYKNGIAVAPGSPVKITAVGFDGNDIRLEVNYGGKKKGSVLRHFEVGVGGSTQPLAPPSNESPRGSYITLKDAGGMSLGEIKKALSAVIDFERHSPTVLYSASVPPKVKEAIEKHEVLVGMDQDAVLSAKGVPDRKVRETEGGAEKETWIYGLPPHVLMIVFDENGKAKSVRQY